MQNRRQYWANKTVCISADAYKCLLFLAYGTDLLAFAHLVIAVAFIGPHIDPPRNKWAITFGLIACAGVVPMPIIAGPIRGIPSRGG
jgi:hypothetical protein